MPWYFIGNDHFHRFAAHWKPEFSWIDRNHFFFFNNSFINEIEREEGKRLGVSNLYRYRGFFFSFFFFFTRVLIGHNLSAVKENSIAKRRSFVSIRSSDIEISICRWIDSTTGHYPTPPIAFFPHFSRFRPGWHIHTSIYTHLHSSFILFTAFKKHSNRYSKLIAS